MQTHINTKPMVRQVNTGHPGQHPANAGARYTIASQQSSMHARWTTTPPGECHGMHGMHGMMACKAPKAPRGHRNPRGARNVAWSTMHASHDHISPLSPRLHSL